MELITAICPFPRCSKLIKINLTGEMAEKYDIYYRVHAQNFGWLDWAKNGAASGTEGYSYRLEAIEIKLVKKEKGHQDQQKIYFINIIHG